MDVWNFSDFLQQHAVKWTLLFGVGGENFVLKMLNQKGPKMDQK